MYPYVPMFGGYYNMDDLFPSSYGTFNYTEIERARRRNRRAKAFKRSR